MHVDPRELPDDLVSIRIAVPDTTRIQTLEAARLPAAWRSYPAPDELAAIGDRWLQRGEGLLLAVPSAVIPEEYNVLVNPRHPDIAGLEIGAPARFDFDRRFFARAPRRVPS